MVKIKKPEQMTSIEVIHDLEKKIKLKFPKDYVDFLLEYNGGHPEQNLVPLSNDDGEYIAYFNGIGLELYNDLYAITYKDIYQYSKRMPKKTIPISGTIFGDHFIMSLHKKTYGFIYFWNHEEEFEYERKGNKLRDLMIVASSFNELLDMMKPHQY